jgi:hypothetical protein
MSLTLMAEHGPVSSLLVTLVRMEMLPIHNLAAEQLRYHPPKDLWAHRDLLMLIQ